MKNDKRAGYEATKKAVKLSVILNVILTVYKLFIGYIGNSSAVIADGIHSLSDLLTDFIVMIGVKISVKPEDEDHPYGHGKVETFSSFFIAITLIIVAVGVMYKAYTCVIRGGTTEPVKMITLTAVLLSLGVKEYLFRYTLAVGKKHNLNSLIANAWHHRSDAYSSIAAMAGVIGSMMGAHILDPIAAAVVAYLIAKVGFDIGKEAFMDLIDTAADKKIQVKIERIIEDADEVISYHGLKTRKMGNMIVSDLQIKVDPSISVVKGHDIARELKAKVLCEVEEVENLLIHVEPLGAEHGASYVALTESPHDNEIKELCRKIPGVLGVHSMKIHHFEKDVVLNIDIEVDQTATVKEGHDIARAVKETLMRSDCNVKDVVVHIDPYSADE